MRPKVGVGVMVIHEGRVLFGKRKGAHGSGDWSFPGGHLEHGEDVADCARRELLEETGLRARSLELGPWVSDIIDGNHYITLFAFVYEFEGELVCMEPEKCEGWHWLDANHLPQPLFPPIESLMRKMGGLLPLNYEDRASLT
ncbi:MAG: RNA pyrophosphohydrolase [Chlamydiae bacterium]|nr:RNA pyrophosphohydrolase [Chlamydiota bacterium]